MSQNTIHIEPLIVIPAFNEESQIGAVISKLKEHGYNDILVVDDGSVDATADIARKAGCKVIHHVINRGAGAATQTAIDYAREKGYGYVVTIDADNQHDPEDISKLLQTLEEKDADLAIGNRFMRGDNFIPRSRVIYNGMANLITYIFSRHWVSDTQSGMKALNRKAIEKTQLRMDGFEFCSEWVIKANRQHLRICEVPIKVYYTEESQKKGQGLMTGIRTLTSLFQHLMARH